MGSGFVGGMVTGVCNLVSPFVGSNSQVLSLVFLITLGVMLFLWWINESKESVIVYALRTGVALAALMNLFTLPQLVGLPGVCS